MFRVVSCVNDDVIVPLSCSVQSRMIVVWIDRQKK